MTVLTEPGDKIKGEKIICQYRRERQSILVQLTGGHKGMRKVIEGLPAEATIDKKWRLL
jgi:hypothetical protein